MGRASVCELTSSCIIAVLFIVACVTLVIVFGGRATKDPVFTVEGAAVRAYNLTADGRLFCIFDLSIRAHNRDRKHHVAYKELDLQVRKGKHHTLADDVVISFRQAAGEDTVVAVEAVGLYVQLKEKIAREVRADRAAGSTAVNVFLAGELGNGNNIDIECMNVKEDFQSGEFAKVGCNVSVYYPSADA